MTEPEDCYACAQDRQFETLPPRERIAADEFWRLAHAFGTALPGWLVLLPRRHVTSIADLTGPEAADLGNWQLRGSRAVQQVTGCAKTYVVAFAEAKGHSHVHFHLIPRSPELPPELRGPGVFELLTRPESEHVTPAEMDRLALAIRERLD